MDLESGKKLAQNFLIGEPTSVKPLGNGNINTTFLIKCQEGNYVLQKINKYVFKKPDEVMENIKRVTSYLKKQILCEGGDAKRGTLFPIETLEGQNYFLDETGEYWRMYDCIEDAITYDQIEDPQMFYQTGKAFGEFQERLIKFKVDSLHETITDFHNTPKRYSDFEQAILADKAGRLQEIKGQPNAPLKQAIDFIIEHKKDCSFISQGKLKGKFPIRVTHNDTKINNIMMDRDTGKPICVIDLDTVMPDSPLVDFGDAIRSGTNKAGEEAKNLEDVSIDLELFEAFSRGFVEEAKSLTDEEKNALYIAPKVLTLELGIRFLTDYLDGDKYFTLKENSPKDLNLHRALVQLKLAQDMEQKENQMKSIIENIIGRTDESNDAQGFSLDD